MEQRWKQNENTTKKELRQDVKKDKRQKNDTRVC